MKTRSVVRAVQGLRALAAVLMIFGFLAGGAQAAAAQRDESGVDGNVYTGENFDWSLEWDEDVWAVESEDSGGGSDSLILEAVKGPFALVSFIASDDNEDVEACLDFWFTSLHEGGGYDDVTEADALETLPVPDGGADVAYNYLDGGVTGYAQCRPIEGGDGILLLVLTTMPEAYENRLKVFADLIEGIEGVAQPDADAGDEDDEAADEGAIAGSGVDGETYTSPTYGYGLDWGGTAFEPSLDEELVNEEPDGVGMDRLLLLGAQGNFYIEGKVDYEGDARDCLKGEVGQLAAMDEVVSIVEYVDDGEVVRGRSDGRGRYGAYVLTRESDGDEFEWMAYIECRPLVEGESVVVFSLFTSPEQYQEELDEAQAVIDTFEPGAEGVSRKAQTDEVEPDPQTFESELYDYAVTYDRNIWPNSSSYSWEGQEQIEITSGATTLTLHAYDAGEDDAGDCLRAAERQRERADGLDNVEVADDLPLPIDQDGVEGVVLTYDMEIAGRGEVAMTEYVGCARLDGAGTVLEISVLTRSGIYDEEVGIAADVLATLELPLE